MISYSYKGKYNVMGFSIGERFEKKENSQRKCTYDFRRKYERLKI